MSDARPQHRELHAHVYSTTRQSQSPVPVNSLICIHVRSGIQEGYNLWEFLGMNAKTRLILGSMRKRNKEKILQVLTSR